MAGFPPSYTKAHAQREKAAVEAALRGGARVKPVHGSHERGVYRIAAAKLGIPENSLRRRVGSPTDKGAIARKWPDLAVDWSLADRHVPRQPYSDEELQRVAEAFKEHGSKIKARKALGLGKDAFTRRLELASEHGMVGTKPVMPGYYIKQVSSHIGPDGELKGEHIQQRRGPGPEFNVPEGHLIKGVSALTDSDGRIINQWVKTKTDSTTADLVEALKHVFKNYKGRAKPIPAPKRVTHDLLSVYPIADQHVGLLSWKPETGENYDLKIGAERLRSCIGQVISQAPPSRRAVILNLGDWQHTDDQKNMTPRSGNLLDVDGRYFKVLTTGVHLMMDCIELALQRHHFVLVRNVPGNHDPHASIALTVALSAFYSRHKRVTIDADPSDFFYHRFGQVLIGANHGHKLRNPADMAMTMATERRDDWGSTKYHYFYHGHIHHEKSKEIGDCVVESFRTIAAKDAHAAQTGYRSGKSLVSITHHRQRGEIGRHRVNL